MAKTNFKDLSGHARKRLYVALPYAAALAAAYGLVAENKVALWVGFLGVILGPIQGHVAAAHVPPDDDETNGGPSQPGG
jgi:hypothetical protein